MRLFNVLPFLFCFNSLTAQDTSYYDAELNKVTSLNTAAYYEYWLKDSLQPGRWTLKSFYPSGQRRSERIYVNQQPEGKHLEWYENGRLKREIHYHNGSLDGNLLTWWENGERRRSDRYAAGELVEGKCFDRQGGLLPHMPYEIKPEFPGGMSMLRQYLSKELKYPPTARSTGTEGRVMVRFIINKDGTISSIAIQEGVNAELDAEAIRVIKKMPAWQPGWRDGEKERYPYKLPVVFKLSY